MAFTPGKSGNPGGRPKEKPFHDVLQMELKAAGEDHKALRAIARNIIKLAQQEDMLGLNAAREVANRLDGTPAQTIENLNENVNYVALMPPKAENMDSWLKHYSPDQTLTKQ